MVLLSLFLRSCITFNSSLTETDEKCVGIICAASGHQDDVGCMLSRLLRIGELTTPDDGSYDPSVHLSFGDVAVDDPGCPAFVRVTIKQSKTDPFVKRLTFSSVTQVAIYARWQLC